MDEENKKELLMALIAEAEKRYQDKTETIEELRKSNLNKSKLIYYYKQKLAETREIEKAPKEMEKALKELEEATQEIEKLKKSKRSLTNRLYDAKTRSENYREEIAEYKEAFRRMQKELVEAKEEVKAFKTILDPKSSTILTEDGYTERELAYRRIAQKYAHKCDDCPLKTEKRKKENVWTD